MIMLITGNFPLYGRDGVPTGKTKFVVSYGVSMKTDNIIILPNEPPNTFPGAFYSMEAGEWFMPED